MRWLGIASISLFIPMFAWGQTSVKIFISPDTTRAARITTVQDSGGRNLESKIEFRRGRRDRLGYQNFISKNHETGFGILKAAWTFDSRFFVFSTMASGGREAGCFPTFFYSKDDNKVRSLDGAIKIKIADPEFFIDPPDIVWIVGLKMSMGYFSDTLITQSVRLSDLVK